MTFGDNLIFTLIKIVFITTCTLGMMSTLTVFKYTLKKVFVIFAIYLFWVTLSTTTILHLFGYNGILRAFLFTISAPAIFIAFKMDQHLPLQSVFNYATQIAFSIILTIPAILLNTAVRGNLCTDLLIRGSLYALVIFLEYHFLRTPFRRLADVIPTGWGALSLIPIFFTLLVVLVGTVPVHYTENPIAILYIGGIVIGLFVVYFVVFQSLMRQYQLQMLSRDKDILKAQIFAMNKQAEAVLIAEEKLHILRHDVRHFALIMQSALQNGATMQAEEILSGFERIIMDTSVKYYCEDYVINSTLASYFEKAEKDGIAVNVKFTAPPADKIDSTAFAVALANALENAIDACNTQKENSFIALKSRILNGQYLLELSNTCNNAVILDKNGLPVSTKGKGHGIGTRSILAFAKANDIILNFTLVENHFVMQMLCNLE